MGGKIYGFDFKCLFLSPEEVFLRSVKAYRVLQVQRMILGFYRPQKDLSLTEKQVFESMPSEGVAEYRWFLMMISNFIQVLGFYRSQKASKIAELQTFKKSLNFATFAPFFICVQIFSGDVKQKFII